MIEREPIVGPTLLELRRAERKKRGSADREKRDHAFSDLVDVA